jgi:spermidine synthase
VSLRVVPDAARPSGRTLLLGVLEASYVDLDDPTHLEFEYVRRLGDLIDVMAPPHRALRALHLGGGACTLARYLAATRPGSGSEVVEVDPAVIRAAREQLELPPGIKVVRGDARDVLERKPARAYDVVVGDVFTEPHTPRHLTTLEFAHEVRRTLAPGGVYALNLITSPPPRLARRQVATLLDVFAEVVALAPRSILSGRRAGNLVLAAADRTLPLAKLRKRARGEAEVLGREEIEAWCGAARPLQD